MTASLLIVDDEFGVAETVAELLAEEGYQVATATNGRHALELLAKQPVDLVILDVMMPVLDGRATLREMQASAVWCDIPVLLMSAAGEVRDLLREGHAPVRFIKKPFKFQVLLRSVVALLASRS